MSNLSEEQLAGIACRFSECLSLQDDQDEFVSESVIEGVPVNKPAKYMDSFPRGKALFLGAGGGWEVKMAQDMGFDAYGITLGKPNLNFAHGELALPPEKFIEGISEVLPFSSETFDVVAGFQIFEHTTAPLLFLMEQSRVLRTGGTILLEWPPSHSTSSHDPKHQICFTPGQAEALLLKAGFGEIKMSYSHYPSDKVFPVPASEYWSGHPEHGYVVAQAKKE